MTSPIEVTGTTTLSAGPYTGGANAGAGDYIIDASSTLILQANLTVSDSTAGDYLAGVTAGGAGAQFTVASGGAMTTNGSGSGDTAFGFFAADQAGFENDGSFTVTSAGYASGVSGQAGVTFVNNGSFTVTASGND